MAVIPISGNNITMNYGLELVDTYQVTGTNFLAQNYDFASSGKLDIDESLTTKNCIFEGSANIDLASGKILTAINCCFNCSKATIEAAGGTVNDTNCLFSTDPGFIGDGNYHLASGSPCINTGIDVGLTEDLDGNPVPVWSYVDIGCYEYQQGSNLTGVYTSPIYDRGDPPARYLVYALADIVVIGAGTDWDSQMPLTLVDVELLVDGGFESWSDGLEIKLDEAAIISEYTSAAKIGGQLAIALSEDVGATGVDEVTSLDQSKIDINETTGVTEGIVVNVQIIGIYLRYWTKHNCTISKVVGASGYGVEVTTTAADGYIHQCIDVTAGVWYKISFSYKNASGDEASFGIYDVTNGNWVTPDDVISLEDDTSWTASSYLFQVPTGCESVQIRFGSKNSGDVVSFDGASIKEIDEVNSTTWDDIQISMRSWTEIFELAAGPSISMRLKYGDSSPPANSVERLEILSAIVTGRYFQLEITITDPSEEVHALVEEFTLKFCQ